MEYRLKCEGEKVKINYSALPQWPLLKIRYVLFPFAH